MKKVKISPQMVYTSEELFHRATVAAKSFGFVCGCVGHFGVIVSLRKKLFLHYSSHPAVQEGPSGLVSTWDAAHQAATSLVLLGKLYGKQMLSGVGV